MNRSCDDTLVVIMAGGRGSRLAPLTDLRCKPALPFGGSWRTVDFVLSNCLHSGLHRIGVLTQYHAYSLIRHLSREWQPVFAGPDRGLEVWPAEQRPHADWYCGTANAVYQNLDIVRRYRPRRVLVLAADHVYRMDYRELIEAHERSGASVTVGCIEVPRSESRHFGVMVTDGTGRIVKFAEKPANPLGMTTPDGNVLASMGIYLFDADTLLATLERDAGRCDSGHDFGGDIVPDLIANARTPVCAHAFGDGAEETPYWRDIGTLDSYWRAHMDLVQPDSALDIHDPDWPILGGNGALPPPRLMSDPRTGQPAVIFNSLVAGGCRLDGMLARDSVLFPNVSVGAGSVLERCVVLPGARIGRGCRLSDTIVDEDCELPDGTVIGQDRARDARYCEMSEHGVAVVSSSTADGLQPRRVSSMS